MKLVLILPGFWGCPSASSTPAPTETGASNLDDSAESDSSTVEDTGERDTGPTTTTETIGDQPEVGNDWLFDDTVVHTVAIEIDDTSWNNLLSSPYDYTNANIEIDGEPAPDVGLRIRGKIGSYRPITGKPKFKIDFNHYESGRRFYGLKSLSLNNAVVDCSYEKELIGYEVLRQLGLPSPRIAYANVTINAVDYGLYLLLETEDNVFLERNYTDGTGNLYDGKYEYEWTTGAYSLIDFTDAADDLFQLEEGTDVGHADIYAITAAAAASYGSGAYEAGVGGVVDLDRFHVTMAAEQWLGHNDGYALNTNNYRVYFDPADGKMDLISWDFDYTFLEDSWWGMNWWAPRGTLAAGCWSDPGCIDAQRQAAINVTNTINTTTLGEKLTMWESLSNDRAYSDPRRECSVENVAAYRQYVRDWLTTRPAYMHSFWGF